MSAPTDIEALPLPDKSKNGSIVMKVFEKADISEYVDED